MYIYKIFENKIKNILKNWLELLEPLYEKETNAGNQHHLLFQQQNILL